MVSAYSVLYLQVSGGATSIPHARRTGQEYALEQAFRIAHTLVASSPSIKLRAVQEETYGHSRIVRHSVAEAVMRR